MFIIFCWYTDVRNINPGFVSAIPVPASIFNDSLCEIECHLMTDYERNKQIRYNKSTKCYESYYYPVKSKAIIDEIDKVLAKHYGFTEEELDFIINYDIKYRMGDELGEDSEKDEEPKQEVKASLSAPKERKTKNVNLSEPEDKALTMYVRHETLERISSGEKTTFKRYLNDEDFAKEVLVTENGKYKPSDDNCPYTAKNITSIKLVCDKETLVKKVTKITFRKAKDEQGNNAWKIVFHF